MASNNSSSEGGHVSSSEQWDGERVRCRRLVVARQPRSWMKSHVCPPTLEHLLSLTGTHSDSVTLFVTQNIAHTQLYPVSLTVT